MNESSWSISDVGLMELIELALDGQMTAETFTELAFHPAAGGRRSASGSGDPARTVEVGDEPPGKEESVHFRAQKPQGQLYPLGSESLMLKWQTIVDGLEQ